MKEHNEIEQILLNDSEYEKITKAKLEQDFRKELNKKSCQNSKNITDIKLVPKDKIFSKFTIFEVLNKVSKTSSKINGLQADGYLGKQNSDRIKLQSGEIDSFVCGDKFVKFLKYNG
ncbi:MAG: hypothetical protein DK841_04340 [Candidatus Melainabacteria bacterium]|nr:MAG: hypothetical protein DK841_04340 [Candidatus Melainabacteria bacterium]